MTRHDARQTGDAARPTDSAQRARADSHATGDRAARDGQEGTRSDADDGAATELVAEDLVLSYPTSDAPIVDGESVAAEPGAVTALVGPNGSGKSTLLKGLADQVAPDAGTVRLDGRDVHTMDTKELATEMGLLSQESTVPESLTVEDLVYHGRYPHRGFFEHVTEDDRRAVDRAIELAGCDHLRDREVGSLSGGQKQLAWIAMVLAQETDVLLLDEPTTFLDLHHQMEVLEIVETLRDESDVTIVLVLHDLEQAARVADRVVALKDGAVQAAGAPGEVLTEQLLAEVFRVDAEVCQGSCGLVVRPQGARHASSDDESDSTTGSSETDAPRLLGD